MVREPRPTVAISGRRSRSSLLTGRDPRFSATEFDSFSAEFASCVADAGGTPVYLPFEAAGAELPAGLDALILSGGQDVHPSLWGGEHVDTRLTSDPRTSFISYDPQRDKYEAALLRSALATGIPVLAVCRGMQLLNVVRGGTLIADLASLGVEHDSRSAAYTDGAADHTVTLSPGSLAGTVYGSTIVTNSWHHQAVAEPGDGVAVTGRAQDGTVEAVELLGRDVLGIQWHPEWRVTSDPAFRWLVDAAGRRGSRTQSVAPVPCETTRRAERSGIRTDPR